MKSIFQTLNLLLNSKIQTRSALQTHLNSSTFDTNYINDFIYNVFERSRKHFIQFLPVLIQKGGNINEFHQPTKGITIFMAACIQGEVEIVEKMLEYQVDLGRRDAEGNNVLVMVLKEVREKEKGEREKERMGAIAEILLKRQPELAKGVWKREEGRETGVLMMVGEWESVGLIKLIVGYLDDLNQTNQNQETILHLVSKRFKNKQNQVELVKLLVEKKVNICKRNRQGKLASELVDVKYQKEFEELIGLTNSVKQREMEKQKEKEKSQKKKNKNDTSKDISKVKKKMINNNVETIIVNQENEKKNIQQATHYLLLSLEQQLKQLTQTKNKKEQQYKRIEEEQRNIEIQRQNNWHLTSDELKYYLQEEIKLFADQIEQKNRKDKEHYDGLIEKIAESLEKELDIQVKVYGSFATRLCLSDSDIDVVVIANTPIETSASESELLEKIDKKLRDLSFIGSTKFIKSATMPVIKVMCSEEYNSKKIDITLQNVGHNGLDCVNIIKHYMEKYQQLRPLTFVLKSFLYSSNLYDTYQGGLSSYGLILMIVSILQGYEAMKKQNQKILISQLFIKFLWCYGYEFDYINKAIFVQSPFININRTNYKGFWTPFYYMDATPRLYLIDPLNVNNNVGRSTHQIKQIGEAFSNAYTLIHTNYSCMNKECRYRQRVEKAVLPKEMEKRKKPRPCCILNRMFECNNV